MQSVVHRGAMRGDLSLLTWISLLGACSGSPAVTPAPAPVPHPAAQVTTAPVVPDAPADRPAACPSELELGEELRATWQVPRDATIDVVACVPGHFGRPGWLVDVFIDQSDEESEEVVALVATDGSGVIARAPARHVSAAYRHETGPAHSWEIVDRDGDGVDEVVRYVRPEGAAEVATVFQVRGEHLIELMAPGV